jgi:RNA polymerase sigma-70 factor (ECF subfamily)
MSSEKKPVRHHHHLAVVERRDDGWRDLIDRTVAGDEAAFAELYDRSCALVNGLALRIVRDAAAAEEVALDVYMQVWRQAARYDPARGSVRAWLLLLTRSRAIDTLRATVAELRQREPLQSAALVASIEPGPEEHVALGQRRGLVERACATLAADQREAIELAYFRGMSHTEIASALHQPLGTVKTRIRSGMMRLRATLVRAGEEPW